MSIFVYKNSGIMDGKQEILRFLFSEKKGVRDTIEPIGEGLFVWRREIDKVKAEVQDLQRNMMSIVLEKPTEYFMIPGISYNGNQWGEGKEPKGISHEGEPWRFAWHRSTVPAGLFCQSKKWKVAMWGGLENTQGFSGSLEYTREGKMKMSVCFPEQEGPWIYCARDTYEKKEYLEATADTGRKMQFIAWIQVGSADEKYDTGKWLDSVWKICQDKDSQTKKKLYMDKKKVWDLGICFLTKSAWFEEDGFTGFCMGLTWNGKLWEQKRDYLEVGWVGQNASCGVSLICDGILSGNPKHIDKGMRVLDCWLDCCLENGLFRCRYDLMRQYKDNIFNRRELQDAANLYSVADEYLEAWKILKEIGISRDIYKKTALALCDFAVKSQEESGCMGKAWYNDGTCVQREGGIGCYMVAALCRAIEETGEEKYLVPAMRGFEFYFNEYMKNGYTTAGALDTCCIDKESAFPLLKTALCLYKRNREKKYLDCAVKISNYIATWQYHYNVTYPEDTILGKIGYETRGGMAVSTQHHHIDCYGLFIYADWKELAKLSGNLLWEERAEAVWKNSLQNISDGTLSIKGQLRPAGSQDEGFLQTRWHTKKGEYFGVSEWLVLWNTAFRLKILRREYLTNNREKDKG